MLQISQKSKLIIPFLKKLRTEIITYFENFESSATFKMQKWDHHGGGGGEISLIRGDVFEKAAVNWSGVYGDKLPFETAKEPFFATGISLITHMNNPFMPTVHMNLRFLETPSKWWFGGGYDLTPMGFENSMDTKHFHNTAKTALGEKLYTQFMPQAQEYFYIKHRKKQRGVGGIFFDKYNTGKFSNDLEVWKSVGRSFLPAILPIYEKKKNIRYTEKEKLIQQRLRAHYVEFNLLYDRGTKFGFISGGNHEAILCSMPPNASW